jgi:hypothetical protein
MMESTESLTSSSDCPLGPSRARTCQEFIDDLSAKARGCITTRFGNCKNAPVDTPRPQFHAQRAQVALLCMSGFANSGSTGILGILSFERFLDKFDISSCEAVFGGKPIAHQTCAAASADGRAATSPRSLSRRWRICPPGGGLGQSLLEDDQSICFSSSWKKCYSTKYYGPMGSARDMIVRGCVFGSLWPWLP